MTISSHTDTLSSEQERTENTAPTYTIVIPVYCNEESIDDLIQALSSMCNSLERDIEIVFVVDGSPDSSGETLVRARKELPCSSKVVFHSRNFGSFTAIRTGLEVGGGTYYAAMAADLQEPPELVLKFFDILSRDEADIVFGKRTGRADPRLRTLASNMFWGVYRRLIQPDMPKGGVDMFGCNRRVRDEILSITEPNSSLIAQLFWVGFRRQFVPYERLRRHRGRSAWNFSLRLRYMMDSIFSNSDLPILIVLYLGVLGCITSFVMGVTTIIARLAGIIEVPGYASLLIAILFFGSAILVAQGLLGSYIWRTFENTKRRPLRIISRVISD